MVKCQVCKRELTDRVSVERGVGPSCWKKLLRAEAEKEQAKIDNFDEDTAEALDAMRNTEQIIIATPQEQTITDPGTRHEIGVDGPIPEGFRNDLLEDYPPGLCKGDHI
jgi:hypothetical protein